MSQENVEAIRALHEDWLKGDMGLERLDPEISMVESATLPGAVTAEGFDAVKRYIESFAKHWGEIRFEPEEFIDAGDAVVVVARLVGKGKQSGVQVARTWAYVWTLRDGRALKMVGYADRSEALRAVGIEE